MSVQTILATAQSQVSEATESNQLEQIRLNYLGKKGQLNQLLQQVGKLPAEQRKSAAIEANQAKQTLADALAERKQEIKSQELQRQLEAEKIDISLPGMPLAIGGLHPVTQTIHRIEDIFLSSGYLVSEGVEIEDDFHNFTALNIAANHPARAMHDTFYFNADLVLRTHTSSVQIRELEKEKLPLRIIAPGRVYRCDSDQTHTPMFHQVEGLLVDRSSSFLDLLSLLTGFLKTFFDDDQLKVRFRPSYFPFTEPSAEVDISAAQLGGDEWLEVLGCGMVHPNVLRSVGVNPDEWTGFAFGMGVERLAMLRHGVKDLRQFFVNDLRFLRQFN